MVIVHIQQKGGETMRASDWKIDEDGGIAVEDARIKVHQIVMVVGGVGMIALLTISYLFGWVIWRNQASTIALSAYGAITLTHITAQTVFAALNRRKMAKINGDVNYQPTVSIQITGYRENPDYFDMCLHSILDGVKYDNLERVVVAIDGDEDDDIYMANIFRRVCSILKVKHQVIYGEPEEIRDDVKAICLLLPHRGKREAMYDALPICMQSDIVVVTDSDTVFDQNAIREIVKPFHDPSVGGATGYVDVFNTETLLAFMSRVRYFYAFNLERGAQSYWDCVNCISGPLGAYRSEAIRPLLDQWKEQSFLNAPCTYGDDRHMTNLILSQGHKVQMTPFAICTTETPTGLKRWVNQQTRWSKSFVREFIINAKWFHKHTFWHGYEMTYQLIYPYFLFAAILTTLAYGEPLQAILFGWTVFVIGIVRAFASKLYGGERRMLCYPLYSVLYMMFLLALKPWAASTLFDNGWGTAARNGNVKSNGVNYTPLAIWWGLIGLGTIATVYRLFNLETFTPTYSISLIGLFILVVGILWGVYYYFDNFERTFEYPLATPTCPSMRKKRSVRKKVKRRSRRVPKRRRPMTQFQSEVPTLEPVSFGEVTLYGEVDERLSSTTHRGKGRHVHEFKKVVGEMRDFLRNVREKQRELSRVPEIIQLKETEEIQLGAEDTISRADAAIERFRRIEKARFGSDEGERTQTDESDELE